MVFSRKPGYSGLSLINASGIIAVPSAMSSSPAKKFSARFNGKMAGK